MEKTIEISGRPVRFKSTGAFLLRYKAQFQRDALKDMVRLYPILQQYQELKLEENPQALVEIVNVIDLQLFYNMAWVMAKVAEPTIPEPMTWLDSFDTFPIMEIMAELSEMLSLSIGVSKKN